MFAKFLNKLTVTKRADSPITEHEDTSDILNGLSRVVANHDSQTTRQAGHRDSSRMHRLATALRRVGRREPRDRVGQDGASDSSGRDGRSLNVWLEILRGVQPGQYSDRAIAAFRHSQKRCICPSLLSNRGDCPIHDDHGRVRPGYPIVIEAPHTTGSEP